MVPVGTPVVLRHRLGVPPLAMGHYATFAGYDPKREDVPLAHVHTWLGKVRLDVWEEWLQELTPEQEARLRYLRDRSDVDTELRRLYVPYMEALERITLLLRALTHQGELDISPLWHCYSGGDVREAYGLTKLGAPTQEELTRRWATLVAAHGPILDLHLAALED